MKKPSAANSSPDRPVLFVDRNLGRHVVGELRKQGANVEAHDDHFPQNTEDTAWLDAVGRKGWIVLTKDQKIRYHPAEKAALKAAKVAAIVLISGNVSGAEISELFTSMIGKIEKAVSSSKRPVMFTFGRDLTLKKVDL